MSISRAFTTRRNGNKKSLDISTPGIPSRTLTTKHSFASGTIQRSKISGPVELISTTNMLTYNAPDLYPNGRKNSSDSGEDSDIARSISSTPPTSPDTSSVESSPIIRKSNQMAHYSSRQNSETAEVLPSIPARAPTHTKKSSMTSSRKDSFPIMPSPKLSVATSRSSISMFSAQHVEQDQVAEAHPFGNELAKVSELAEEYGVQEKMKAIDAEEQELIAKGLFKFRAEDYMSEIHGLFLSAFGESQKRSMSPMWI